MIQYRSSRHGRAHLVECGTIEEALLAACTDLRTGEAEPLGIYDATGRRLHDPQSIQAECIELADEQ
jgi:hypothetical protein